MNEIDLKSFIISEKDYEIGKPLGKGSYATVFAARDKVTKEVLALKKFHSNFTSDQSRTMFMREVETMAKFAHPCVLGLRGYYLPPEDSFESPLILMDFMKRGDLFSILLKEPKGKQPFGWNTTKKMINAFGIALGMSHIHNCGGIHRDLKPANIMLNDNFEPKIADFGLAKIQDENNVMSMIGGSPFWMAPELFNESQYDNKVDVYAYGVLLYQLFTCLIPFNGKISTIALGNKIVRGERPDIPETLNPFYADIINACWAQIPDYRPTFDQIVNRLNQATEFLPGTNVAEYNAYRQSVLGESTALAQGLTVDHYSQGMTLLQSGKYQEAAIEFHHASHNNGKACYELGMMKLKGMGIEMDLNGAAHLFKSAADFGEVNGMLECGKMLYGGIGIRERKDLAAEYFIKAAKKNNEEATILLSDMLIKGEGVEENPTKAVKLLKLAASKGGMEAAYKLGLYHLNSETPDKKQAIKYLAIAANGNHSQARDLLYKLKAQQNEINEKKQQLSSQPSFDVFNANEQQQQQQVPSTPSFDVFNANEQQQQQQVPSTPSFDVFNANEQKQQQQVPSTPSFDVFNARNDYSGNSFTPFSQYNQTPVNSSNPMASSSTPFGVNQVSMVSPQPPQTPTTPFMQYNQPQMNASNQGAFPYGTSQSPVAGPQNIVASSSMPFPQCNQMPTNASNPTASSSIPFGTNQASMISASNPSFFDPNAHNPQPTNNMNKQEMFDIFKQKPSVSKSENTLANIQPSNEQVITKPNKTKRVSLEGDENLTDHEKATRWFQHSKELIGTGKEANIRKAACFLKQAALFGHIESQYQCGVMLLRGIGVEKNPQKAADFFYQAAKNGHINALYECYNIISEGNGVRQDARKAAYMCKLAADGGHIEAIYEFGLLLTTGNGVPQDITNANDFFRAAADLGHVRSQLIIAYNYEKGNGVPLDYSQALKYYKLAAEQHDQDALCNYGRMFEQGLGVTKNVVEAANCYRAAALMGSTLGMFNYAFMLNNGIGTEKDIDSAAKFYKMAADCGDCDSCINYANLLARGWPNHPKDLEGCAQYAKAAASKDNARGLFLYGKLLYTGKGTQKNIVSGIAYIKKAAQQGYKRALKFVHDNGII